MKKNISRMAGHGYRYKKELNKLMKYLLLSGKKWAKDIRKSALIYSIGGSKNQE